MTDQSIDSGAYASNSQEHAGVDRLPHKDTEWVYPGVPFSDSSLITRICRRDEQAFGALYDRYGALIYTLALRITGDRAATEAVVQAAFLALWRSADGFPIGGSVADWLIGITRRQALDAMHTRGEHTAVRTPVIDETISTDIHRRADVGADALTVREALRVLPTSQRAVIELVYYSGLTQAAIAIRLGEPLSTVQAHLRLGLITLRDRLHAGVEESGWN